MSVEFMYYLTVKKGDKLYPYGPFDYKGEYRRVLTVTNESELTGLHPEFYDLKEEMISDELIKALDYNGTEDFFKYGNSYYLPLIELPTGTYIKKAYCLIDDIKRYETDGYYFDGFWDTMTPDEYARRMENELKFGPPKEREDCEGTKYTPNSVSEYSFYMYEDLECPQYYASRIRQPYYMMKRYSDDIKDEDIYVLLVIC